MSPATSEELRQRASTLGVATDFWDGLGAWHSVSDATLRAVLDALGDPPPRDAPWPAVVVTHPGRPPRWRPPPHEPIEVTLESGEQRPAPEVLPGDLPPGYHQIAGATGATSLVVAPERCYLPPRLAQGERLWGWAVQLYAARSRTSWGIGDLGDLATLVADPVLRAGFVLLNPLHAPPTPAHSGPYRASSRLFRNPLYLDVEQVPERAALTGPALARFDELAGTGRRLTSRHPIDRRAIVPVKQEALRLCHAALDRLPARRAELDSWRASTPFVDAFATFCALQPIHGDDWRTWPTSYQHPGTGAVARFRAEHAGEVDYHAWLQWLLEAQLRAIPRVSLGLINDLAIGVASGGFDTWAFQDQLASGLTVGAPPDPIATSGQNWRMPTFAPTKLSASGYAPFIASIRSGMFGAGGLRIDHVMALFRLFLIPDGAEPAQGTYVAYPAEDLLDILALESYRAHALVVGEDLGTVEPGVRERLAASNVLSYRLLLFERDPNDHSALRPAADYPRLALAAFATHDLPTVTGLFSDADLRQQAERGLVPPERLHHVAEANQHHKRELLQLLRREGLLVNEDSDDLGAVIVALYTFLARTSVMLVAATLEDALEVPDRPNVPGTTARQRANWSLPLPALLEDLAGDSRVQSLTATLRTLA